MATKKFPKEALLDLIDCSPGEGFDGYELISDDLWDKTRWSVVRRLLFKYDGEFWSTLYRVGATEYQDERSWQYDGDQIECTEMKPVEKTIVVYQKK